MEIRFMNRTKTGETLVSTSIINKYYFIRTIKGLAGQTNRFILTEEDFPLRCKWEQRLIVPPFFLIGRLGPCLLQDPFEVYLLIRKGS